MWYKFEMDTEGQMSRDSTAKWLESLGAVKVDKNKNISIILPKPGEKVAYEKYMDMLEAYESKTRSKNVGNFNIKKWMHATTK